MSTLIKKDSREISVPFVMREHREKTAIYESDSELSPDT